MELPVHQSYYEERVLSLKIGFKFYGIRANASQLFASEHIDIIIVSYWTF
jgi:hypothetical protein